MPRITLQEQWDTLQQELFTRLKVYSQTVFYGELPHTLFRVDHENQVEELVVVGPDYFYPRGISFFQGNKPTRAEVAYLKEWIDEDHPFEREKLYLDLQTVHGHSTTSFYLDPNRGHSLIFFTAKEAHVETDSRRRKIEEEKRLLSEGHIRCRYCGVVRRPENITYARMWNPVYRGGQSDPRPYCKDKGCAGYDQMGHEG